MIRLLIAIIVFWIVPTCSAQPVVTWRFSDNYRSCPGVPIARTDLGVRMGFETMFRYYNVVTVEKSGTVPVNCYVVFMDFNVPALQRIGYTQATMFTDTTGQFSQQIFGRPYPGIFINRNQMNRSAESIRILFAHEFGHWFGAVHHTGPNIMDPTGSGGVLAWSRDDNAQIIRRLSRKPNVPASWDHLDDAFWRAKPQTFAAENHTNEDDSVKCLHPQIIDGQWVYDLEIVK